MTYTKETIENLLQAAEAGDIDALFELGQRYFYGNGVEKDTSRAITIYEQAGEQGHGQAQMRAGMCYLKGDGVEQDFYKAEEWLEKAVNNGFRSYRDHLDEARKGVLEKNYQKRLEEGDPDAQYIQGYYYQKGKEGEQINLQKAAEWFKKAAEQGHKKAQSALAHCYEKGEGVNEDHVAAAYWYEKLANQGDTFAQYKMGEFYEEGKGVECDLQKALWWYEKAVENDSVLAPDRAAAVRKLLTEKKRKEESEQAIQRIEARDISLEIGAILSSWAFVGVAFLYRLIGAGTKMGTEMNSLLWIALTAACIVGLVVLGMAALGMTTDSLLGIAIIGVILGLVGGIIVLTSLRDYPIILKYAEYGALGISGIMLIKILFKRMK